MEDDGARGADDLLTAPGEIIQALAADLDGTVHRGDLGLLTAKGGEDRLETLGGDVAGIGLANQAAVDVVAVGLDAEDDLGEIRLGG